MNHPSRESSVSAAATSGRRRHHRNAVLPLMAVFGICALTAGGFYPASARADGPPAPAAPAAPAKAAPAPAAPAAATPAVKTVLRYKAQVGQTKRVTGRAMLTFNGSARFEIKETSKVTFRSVDDKTGDISYEDATESADYTMPDGSHQKNDKPDVSTTVMHPNGMLVSYKGSDPNDKDDAQFQARLYNATTVIFSDNPVGVGDKWGIDYKADPALGTRDAHADFELVQALPIGGGDAYKIRMTYTEKGDKAITSKGTFLVEKASGDEIASDYVLDNVAFPNLGLGRGTLQNERLEGGPLLASKNDSRAVAQAMASEASHKDRTIDEMVQDGFEKMPGIVTLYRKKDGVRDQIYAEVREDQLNKLMLLQTTASTGTADEIIPGDPIDDLVFKLVKTPDDRIVLTVPNWEYRATPGTPMEKAVRRSFADAMIQSFTILAKQPDRKSVLIDVSDLFKGDIAQVTQAFSSSDGGGLAGLMGGGGYAIDREKTYIDSVKNFPENLSVRTQYNFMHGGRAGMGGDTLADPRSAAVAIQYNLSALPVDENYQPTNGYKPRLADPRVGYFTAEYIDFSDDSKEDQTRRFIQRWDIRKKDPNALTSEPEKPIVFWLDNAIPVEYRDSVKQALLMWNKAFEPLGIKDAIQVNQMPDDADWDPADQRYNVVRWVVTPDGAQRNGVAVAQARVNPLTGQVLNASITVDASWTRYAKLERRDLIDPATAFAQGADTETDLLITEAKTADPSTLDKLGLNSLKAERILQGDPRYCEAGGAEMRENAWLGAFSLDMIGLLDGGATASAAGGGGAAASAAAATAREKEYTQELIRETVAHEMGHVLGLRHNFIASTAYSLDQLKDPKHGQQYGVTASLMDYNAFNIGALHAKGVPYYQQKPGVYDLWAIDYGYENIPDAKTPDDELPALHRVASLSNMPGHAYQSDEQRIAGWDPNVAMYDMSSDPLAYYGRILDLSRYLLVNLDKRLPHTGDSYWEFTKAFNGLLARYAQAAGAGSRYVGGLYANRNHKGDPGQKPTLVPVDSAKQKQALAMLNKYIFAPDAFSFPERYYTYLTMNPNPTSILSILKSDYPVLDQIGGIQKAALQKLFAGAVLSRVENNEFKREGNPQQALTLPNLFHSVSDNVWADLGEAKLPTLRRQLQRSWLDTMCDMVTKPSSGVPNDARLLAWEQLRLLKPRLATAAQNSAKDDEYTRIHLEESLVRVDRTLSAQVMLNGGAPTSGGGGLLQLLLGGESGSKQP